MGAKVRPGEVRYPHEMSATDFFREASTMRIEMFELVHSLRETSHSFYQKTNIRDSQIDHWLMRMSRQLGEITRQIDEIESKRTNSKFGIFSNWAFNTVTGGVAWDGLKGISLIISNIMKE